jgi:hypothetical protein
MFVGFLLIDISFVSLYLYMASLTTHAVIRNL